MGAWFFRNMHIIAIILMIVVAATPIWVEWCLDLIVTFDPAYHAFYMESKK